MRCYYVVTTLNILFKVNSAQSTPRVSSAASRLEHKFSESALPVSPCYAKRLSADCPELRQHFKPKLSLSALPDMGNQQGRRLSRAAIQMENGETGSSLADSLKLTHHFDLFGNGAFFASVPVGVPYWDGHDEKVPDSAVATDMVQAQIHSYVYSSLQIVVFQVDRKPRNVPENVYR
ncbi:hypothetical protein Y032_0190g1270 [Ancylostoma ceylanicum]|uniref:Uncharacterized protein n=1 Tax=Ancylostoma ceylanicum TaxID=53326 RepID=A0A016SR47_9BILA|nr:hypothetical protein Y032_0190g1270 [Ancylostoma ceylanicum]